MKKKATNPSEVPTKHQSRSAATLREVLGAAERVFIRDGFERAQMETIAAEAGRTKGAVYTHFRSKVEVFFAVLESKAQSRLDQYVRSREGVAFDEVVADGKKLFMETFDEKGWPILLLEFKLYALRHEGSLDRIRDLYRLLYEGAERGLLRPDFGFSPSQKRRA